MRRIILLLVAVGVLMALTGGVVGAETATVRVGGTYEHGRFLVGANGMTLYIFTVDERGKSNCFGKCAEARPPLTVAEGSTPTAGPGIPGKLATIARTDGSPQVTYNGWPLYYWFRDAAVGDSTGHGVGNVWWVMKTDTVATGRNSQLGELVVGETGMTLYIFLKDEVGKSNCTGNCASAWPPLTVAAGASPSRGASVSGRLGTITRDDGSRQITYNGWPLYYWINDAKPGDTTGQNIGNVWFVARPDISPTNYQKLLNRQFVNERLVQILSSVSAQLTPELLAEFDAIQKAYLNVIAGKADMIKWQGG